MEWVEVFGEHTPFEWQLQIARSIVDPWGDDRADTRAQINTSQLLAHQSQDESMRVRVAEMVSRYYGSGDDEDDAKLELNAEALRSLPGVEKT